MLQILIGAVALIILSTGFARAQVTTSLPGYGPDYSGYPVWAISPDYEQTRSPEQLRRDAEIERRYRDTVERKIPDKKGSNDPWHKIRQAPTATAARPSVPDRYRPE